MVRDILTSLLLPTLTSELSTPSWFIQRKSYPPFCLRKLSGPAPSISIAPFISVYFATPFYHSTNQRWSSSQFSCFPPFQKHTQDLNTSNGDITRFSHALVRFHFFFETISKFCSQSVNPFTFPFFWKDIFFISRFILVWYWHSFSRLPKLLLLIPIFSEKYKV